MRTIPTGAIVAFVISMAFGIAAGVIRYLMIEKANERLPNDQQLSHFAEWSDLILFKEKCYRQLYRDGRLHIWFAVCLACTFLLLFSAGWIHFGEVSLVILGLVVLVLNLAIFFVATRPSRH